MLYITIQYNEWEKRELIIKSALDITISDYSNFLKLLEVKTQTELSENIKLQKV